MCALLLGVGCSGTHTDTVPTYCQRVPTPALSPLQEQELEEFRALEREILGGQPQLTSTCSTAAAAAAATTSADFMQAGRPSPPARLSMSAGGAAPAGSDDAFVFDDDTEWVGTEFSFAGLPEQPPSSRPTTQHTAEPAQQRQRHQQQQQQQQQQYTQGPAPPPDGADNGTLSQPYVRALFNRAGTAGAAGGYMRPASSGGGTASGRDWSRRGAHATGIPSSSTQQQHDRAPAALAAGAQPGEMVSVPFAQLTRLCFLYPSEPVEQ